MMQLFFYLISNKTVPNRVISFNTLTASDLYSLFILIFHLE
jgi:hypothetical protein